jgi:hypothetical protein
MACLLAAPGKALQAQSALTLAREGATRYSIVAADDASPVDRYAARELALYLRQITGAEFPVVSETAWARGGPGVPPAAAADPPQTEYASGPLAPRADVADAPPALFVGLSGVARARLGNGDPLADLADQDHVARSLGGDILLYGKGAHGSLYAVMEFLESSLGWRWYSIFEHPVIPSRPTLTLSPFARTNGFDYAYRKVDMQRGFDYYYQQGMNMGFTERVERFAQRNPASRSNYVWFVSAIPDMAAGGHSLFSYMPPVPGIGDANRWAWLETKNYFETNPEYFSLWEHGKRVNNRQLCFSNPGLRREFTRNVLRNAAHVGEPCLLAIGAQDNPGAFCHCPACKALEERYRSPGGPLYDYLLELCPLLLDRHPRARIITLAYRRAQTQKPPVLPEGQKLPANLIIDFAPIEDNYFADWNHPDAQIQETFADLKGWSAITHPGNLWAWLYPNAYGTGYSMPVGNVERNIAQIRLMHQVGVRGIFSDQIGYHQRAGWSELHSYLLYKLCRDVNCDTDAIIREFTDSMYGSAGALIRLYLAELEAGRKAMTELPPGVNFHSHNYDDRTFPYLTPENIHRWQGCFEQMEKRLADARAGEGGTTSVSSAVGTSANALQADREPDPPAANASPEVRARWLGNVRFARRQLDIATLWKWFDLKKAYPETYTDHRPVLERIHAANAADALPAPAWEGKDMNRKPSPGPEPGDFATLIEAGGQVKPLPPEFDGIDPARIRQFVPRVGTWIPKLLLLLDQDAAFGYAVPVFQPDLPLHVGFYQNDNKTHGPRRTVELAEIEAGTYQLFKLGTVTVTPDCVVWFASWVTQLQVGERLFEPGADNAWETYVSLKCLGPSYGGIMGEEVLPVAERDYQGLDPADLVLVDRIILVRTGKDQFAAP